MKGREWEWNENYLIRNRREGGGNNREEGRWGNWESIFDIDWG